MAAERAEFTTYGTLSTHLKLRARRSLDRDANIPVFYLQCLHRSKGLPADCESDSAREEDGALIVRYLAL
jgi:hypothetical protein